MKTFFVKGWLAAMSASIVIGTAGAAGAQGVPTIDTQNIAQQIKQLQNMLEDMGIQNNQLDALLKQITALEQQLTQLQQMYAAMTGKTDLKQLLMGSQFDGLLEPQMASVLDTINGARRGDWSGLAGAAAGKMTGSAKATMTNAGLPPAEVERLGKSGEPADQRIATQATSAAVVSAAAENAHVEAGQGIERIKVLSEEIPKMTTMKEAIDLNTRMTAELTLQVIKNTEMLAVQTVGAGNAGVVDAATIAQERQFMDFTLPPMGN